MWGGITKQQIIILPILLFFVMCVFMPKQKLKLKRYHLDPECGGKNSKPTILDEATLSGLTPCQKCAQ